MNQLDLERQRYLAAMLGQRMSPDYAMAPVRMMSNEDDRAVNMAQMGRMSPNPQGMPPTPAQGAGMQTGSGRFTETNPSPFDDPMLNKDLSAEEARIKRQMDMAQGLRGKDIAQGREVGPLGVYVGPNAGEIAGGVASKLAGGLLGRKANQADAALDPQREGIRKAKTALEKSLYNTERGDVADAAARDAAKMAQDQAQFEAEQKADEAKRKADMLTSDRDRRSREDIAKIRAADDESGYWTPKTAKERETFDSGATKASSTQALLNSYQDDYSAPAAVRATPGGAALSDWYNRTLGDDEQTESAQWWSDKEKRELKPRHELFGSAFTAPEMKAYNATTFSKSDSPEFIRAQLKERLRLETVASEEMAAKYLMSGANPKTVMMNFGDVVDVEQLMADMESGAFDEKIKARKAAARDGKVLGGPEDDEKKEDKKVKRTGTDPETGRKVVEYEDGTVEYL